MKYYVELDHKELGFEIVQAHDGITVRKIAEGDTSHPAIVDFAAVHADPVSGEGLYSLITDGKSYQIYVERVDSGFRVALWRNRFEMKVLTEREWRLKKVAPRNVAKGGAVEISAPMPGLVKAVLVETGDVVSSGQRLLVLEAMKMENEITAPSSGKVTKVSVEAGTVVERGKPLISIES